MATSIIKKPSSGQGNALEVFELDDDNLTVTAGGYASKTYVIDREGYTPIGCVGFSIANATNSGTNSSWISVRSSFCYKGAVDEIWYFQINFRNHGSSNAKVRVRGFLLYEKV